MHSSPNEIGARDKTGRSPLFLAAARGQASIVELLLATDNPDLDTQDKYGLTPLFVAAKNGRESVVKLILAFKNTDIDLHALRDGLGPNARVVGKKRREMIEQAISSRITTMGGGVMYAPFTTWTEPLAIAATPALVRAL